MPYHLEASVPGVVVVGDAWAESAKQVAAAVGEGQLKSDGIEMVTLESTSGSAPSRARSGYSLRWASTSAGLPR
jgi:hypothetical protein